MEMGEQGLKAGWGWFLGTLVGLLTFAVAAAWVVFTVAEGIASLDDGVAVVGLFYLLTVGAILVVGLGIANSIFALGRRKQ